MRDEIIALKRLLNRFGSHIYVSVCFTLLMKFYKVLLLAVCIDAKYDASGASAKSRIMRN